MIEVTIHGLKEAKEKLAVFQGSLDAEEILNEASALLLNRIRTRFLAEQDPDGTPWIPSQASIIRRAGGFTGKPRKYTGTGTLFESGTLFHSLQAYVKGPGERAIGTDVPYAKKHQLGTDGMVQRKFLGFSDEDLSLFEKLVIRRIEAAL